jgi:hypothetical protein
MDMVEVSDFVNVEFKKVVDFFCSHEIVLPPEKTKLIGFSHNRENNVLIPNIRMNFNNIDQPADEGNLKKNSKYRLLTKYSAMI